MEMNHASPELQKFFEKLLGVKQYLKGASTHKNASVQELITRITIAYDLLHEIIKTESEFKNEKKS